MDRAKGAVHEHLNCHAGRWVETFHLRRTTGARQFRFVEVTEWPVRRIGGSWRCGWDGDIIADEKRILAVVNWPRLWRLHFQPPNGAIARVAPAVPHAGTNESKMAGAESMSSLSDLHGNRSL